MWWCLYSFEHMLGIMTGRASSILDGISTCPLPFPFEEESMRSPMSIQLLNNPELRHDLVSGALASTYVRQMPENPPGGRDARYSDSDKVRDATWLRSVPANEALCFLHYIDLAVITQEIVNKVYSMDCTIVPWAHMENRIGELRARIDLWHANVSPAFDFTSPPEGGDREIGTDIFRARLFLAFHYYSARITLGRPCLCRRDAREDPASGRKQTFSHDIAVVTLDSALDMLALIPDLTAPSSTNDAAQLYQICPWWCKLHFLMQSATVLLLELSFGSIHNPEGEPRFLNAAKKAVKWLFAMAGCSVASRRAWELCDGNLRRVARGMSFDVGDLPVPHTHPHPQQDAGTTTGPAVAPTATDTRAPAAGKTNPPPFDVSELSGPPSLGLLQAGTTTTAGTGTSAMRDTDTAGESPATALETAYFPYDPITGEFMRSFFPAEYGEREERWHEGFEVGHQDRMEL